MFTLGHMILAVIITWIFTAFTCLINAGASINNHDEEAYNRGYSHGYKKGYKDGKE